VHRKSTLYKEPTRCNLTVVAATGHGSGWYISSKDVQGRLSLHYVIAYYWMLLQFLVLLMMDAESVRNM